MKPKVSAIKPGSSDRSAVSLIRAAIGDDEAKVAAKTHVHGEEFWGFGLAHAWKLAENCMGIVDDRETFLGHANMSLGLEVPIGPPHTPPELTEQYAQAIDQLRLLTDAMSVIQDPNPAVAEWTGDPLRAE